jgi:hypothetical protein
VHPLRSISLSRLEGRGNACRGFRKPRATGVSGPGTPDDADKI